MKSLAANRKDLSTGVLRLLSLLLLLVTACSPRATIDSPDSRAAVSPTTAPNLVLPTPVQEQQSVIQSAPTAPPSTASPPLLPTATPTDRPGLIVGAPASWTWQAKETAQLLNETDAEWQWLVAEPDDLAAIKLLPSSEGIPVGTRPLAFAVPFATDWESVSSAEAQQILDNGHSFVRVVDWADLPLGDKALRVDGLLPMDQGYPFQQPWSLVADRGYEAAAERFAAALQSVPNEPLVHLAAVGDVMLDRALGAAIANGSLDYPFARVSDMLLAADITVGNLESSLGDLGEPASKHYTFQAPPAAAQSLARSGFDIMSLANNHAMDYGAQALLQAIELLRVEGIAAIGAGPNAAAAHKPQIVESGGLRMAFLAYVNVPVEATTAFDTQTWTASQDTPGLAWGEAEVIAADVTAAKQHSDLVIVVLHSGLEYIEEPSPQQVEAAQAAIDAGASLVIGHHAHLLQGIDFYNGGVIVYGLGNFAFEIDGEPATAILNVWLDRDGVRQVELVPGLIQSGGQPRLAESWEAGPILERVYFLTRILNAR
jgi:poly-gamma-glutamate capsule biosynthesis protein CapA/YwtB (metallophosphatase superfamily)